MNEHNTFQGLEKEQAEVTINFKLKKIYKLQILCITFSMGCLILVLACETT